MMLLLRGGASGQNYGAARLISDHFMSPLSKNPGYALDEELNGNRSISDDLMNDLQGM